MPREREFDPEEALDKIMRLFWRQGYLDTSVDDLVAFTGVSRYGLYGAFGGKHEMLLAALDRYRDTLVTPRVEAMEAPDAGLDSIHGYFQCLMDVGEPPEAGCLMSNIATELAPHDRRSAKKVNGHFARLEAAFRNALSNARKEGEIDPTLDVETEAAVLNGVVQGGAVMARAGADCRAIEKLVRGALARLG